MKSENPKYTHKGMFCGVVPVYLDMSDENAPVVGVRHWSLEPIMDVVEFAFGCCIYIRTMIDSDYEPTWPIKITGEMP